MRFDVTKTRTYLVNSEGKRKMIPAAYIDVVMEIVNKLNFEKVFLSKKERFLLQAELFKKKIMETERYIYELIEKNEVEAVFKVSVKFDEDRTEVKFGKWNLRCPEKLYEMATPDLQRTKYSAY